MVEAGLLLLFIHLANPFYIRSLRAHGLGEWDMGRGREAEGQDRQREFWSQLVSPASALLSHPAARQLT